MKILLITVDVVLLVISFLLGFSVKHRKYLFIPSTLFAFLSLYLAITTLPHTTSEPIDPTTLVATTRISDGTIGETREEPTITEKATTVRSPVPVDNHLSSMVVKETEGSALTKKEGTIYRDEQEDVYSFQPPRKGTYRFQIENMYEEKSVSLFIKDQGDGVIENKYNVYNGDGITVSTLDPQQVYNIVVKQNTGYSSYTLSVGFQQPTIRLTGQKTISGNIDYYQQRNLYSFYPSIEGTYRFEINDLYAEKSVTLYIYDAGNGTVEKAYNIENGYGITTTKLKKDKTYTIAVEYARGYTPYVLSVGYPKKITDISTSRYSTGAIEYVDQKDRYVFYPSDQTEYQFIISELLADKAVTLRIVDDGGGTIKSYYHVENDQGIKTDALKVGQKYYIEVEYKSGFTPYSLRIIA